MTHNHEKTNKYVVSHNGVEITKIGDILKQLSSVASTSPSTVYRKSIDTTESKKKNLKGEVIATSGQTKTTFTAQPAGTLQTKGTIPVSQVLAFFASRAGRSSELRIVNTKTDSGALTTANLEQAYIEAITMIKNTAKSNSWERYLHECFVSSVSYGSEVLAGVIRILNDKKPNDTITDDEKVKALTLFHESKNSNPVSSNLGQAIQKYFSTRAVKLSTDSEELRRELKEIIAEGARTYLVQSHEGKFTHKTFGKVNIEVEIKPVNARLIDADGTLQDKNTQVFRVLVTPNEPNKKVSLTARPKQPDVYYSKVNSNPIKLYLTEEVATKKRQAAKKDAEQRKQLASVDGPIVTMKATGGGKRAPNSDDTDRRRFALSVISKHSKEFAAFLDTHASGNDLAEQFNQFVKDHNLKLPLYRLLTEEIMNAYGRY